MVEQGYLLFKNPRLKKPYRLDYSSRSIGMTLGFFNSPKQAETFAKTHAKANKYKFKLIKKY